ncbi:MAG TPA: tetratricopeptide repeat protein [Myxococcaceae bacterium]|nr:tetratricopeptide repeat protein [Myxococcaceae bacterium]
MAEKLKRKELRAPDALQRAGLEARHWMEGREKLIVGTVVAVVAIGAAVALFHYFSDRSERMAERQLGTALIPLTRPVAEPGQQPPPNLPETEKPFATQREKDEAVVASLTKFRQEHRGTRSATTAALPLAQSLNRLGRYDEALKAYDEFLKGAAQGDPLRAAALEGKGYAYEAKGQLDEALRAYDELARLQKAEFLDGMGLFHRARILILQGKKEEAAQALSEIPPAFPNSAAARMATERLNLLASQGVKVPPPAPAAAPAAQDAGAGT